MTYLIKRTRRFNGPSTKVDYYSVPNCEGYEFNPRSEAERFSKKIAEGIIFLLKSEKYELAHNESGRLEYTVVRA